MAVFGLKSNWLSKN